MNSPACMYTEYPIQQQQNTYFPMCMWELHQYRPLLECKHVCEICEDGAIHGSVLPSTLDVEAKGWELSHDCYQGFLGPAKAARNLSQKTVKRLGSSRVPSFSGTTLANSTSRKARGVKHVWELKNCSYTTNESKIEMAREIQNIFR